MSPFDSERHHLVSPAPMAEKSPPAPASRAVADDPLPTQRPPLCGVCGGLLEGRKPWALYHPACKPVADWIAALERAVKVLDFPPTEEGRAAALRLRRRLFGLANHKNLPVPGRERRQRDDKGHFLPKENS